MTDRSRKMEYKIEVEREEDGRWIAEVMDMPGVMVYGTTKVHAIMKAKLLTLQVIAAQAEAEEKNKQEMSIADSFFFAYA